MDFSDRLAQERRARLAAQRLLEQKSRELFAANEKLSLHARSLSDQIVEQRQVVKSALTEAETLKDQASRFVADLDRAHTSAVMAERRLWDSINTIDDGFAVFDSAQKLVAANQAYLALFDPDTIPTGIPYPTVLALAASQGRVDLGDERPEDWLAQMLSRWDSDPMDPITLKFHNGTWVRMVDRRARDGDMVSLVLNITDQMRIWAAIEAIPDGFVLFDREERLVTCNQRYRDIYPETAAMMMPGAPVEELLRHGLRQGVDDVPAQAPTNGGRYCRPRQGSVRWFQWNLPRPVNPGVGPSIANLELYLPLNSNFKLPAYLQS